MGMRFRFICLLVFCCALSRPAWTQTWHSMGPPGGDVRATAADPQNTSHIYLGTADGHVFGSQDAGETWNLLGRVSPRVDSVVATMLVDPRQSQTLFAGSWTRDPSLGAGGGIFRSDDGGLTWRASGLAGQAVRALVQAPSNPNVLVAGTLEGVFASKDSGASWQRISPRSNQELRNIDSLAVDPRHPEIIYVGTFHLPWKTTDGGRTWTSIHQGMIDDSDVMSFLVDRTNPLRIFASACSGIYRSDNGGLLWKKVQGIPFSARRTHVLAQDSTRASVIYAGTTEGLWRSDDAGGNWRQVTPADWVINSVEVPIRQPGRVVIGTTELGILVSDDRGEHFTASNEGFNHRRTLALALDPDRPGRVLAVLANGPEPLLVTDDGGLNWEPLGKGVSNNQLLRVYAAPDGWWAALAGGGLVRYDATRKTWVRQGQLVGEAAVLSTSKAHPRGRSPRVTAASLRKAAATAKATSLSWIIQDMAFSETRWFAASQYGLLVSANRGRSWNLLPFGPLADLPVSSVRVSSDGKSVWAVSLRGLVFSSDGGHSWTWRDLPLEAGGALRLDIIPGESGNDTFVATAHRGLFLSRDAGASWQQAAFGLPQAPIQDLAIVDNVIVASPTTGGLYLSTDTGRTWRRLPGTIAEGTFSAVATQPGATAVVAASSDGVYSLNLAPPGETAAHLVEP
jgi:photosystem II stability/assembly factor-like uncharacterized protein